MKIIILIEYGTNFTGRLEGFVSKNTEIKIDHVYKSNDVKDYIRTINIMEIEPGETIRLVFIICLIKKSLKMN